MNMIKKAYAAKTYHDKYNNIVPDKIELNVPDILPTLPTDDKYITVGINNNYFANKNYPPTRTSVNSNNFIMLPFLNNNKPSSVFKGDAFLIIMHNDKIEDGYIIKI